MRLLAMSLAMFGQNKFLSALSLMDVVPWCAACSVSSVLFLSSSGTTPCSPCRPPHREHVPDPSVGLYVGQELGEALHDVLLQLRE